MEMLFDDVIARHLKEVHPVSSKIVRIAFARQPFFEPQAVLVPHH
jgi:hypothetical protein